MLQSSKVLEFRFFDSQKGIQTKLIKVEKLFKSDKKEYLLHLTEQKKQFF